MKPSAASLLSILWAIHVGIFTTALIAQTADTSDSTRFVLKSYGGILYQHFDYGPDQKTGDNGSPSDDRAQMDIPRFVLETKYYFEPDLYLEAEIEFEHGGTGAAFELEFEEFGEFEQEVEKGGEVVLEELYLSKRFAPEIGLRIGHFVLPIGLLNSKHHPTDFFATVRPEAETSTIPTTWHETGAEVYGRFEQFSYRAGIVNGLDATGFSSKFWISGGHQGRFEHVRADNLAYYGRLDFQATEHAALGASFYRGNSTGNRPKEDMEGIDGFVTIGEAHGVWQSERLKARAAFLRGSLQNSDRISAKNSRLSAALEVAKTPVAAAAQFWYAELAYDVLPLIAARSEMQLYPFARYEQFNTMQEVEGNVLADPRFDRNILTLGLNFYFRPNIVLKADYAMRRLGDDRFNDENTVGIALAFTGTFIDL